MLLIRACNDVPMFPLNVIIISYFLKCWSFILGFNPLTLSDLIFLWGYVNLKSEFIFYFNRVWIILGQRLSSFNPMA